MTLKNLLGISLDAVPPDPAAIGRLLAAAQRNLADRGRQGHHPFVDGGGAGQRLPQTDQQAWTPPDGVQTLTTSAGVATARVIVLDALRKQRSVSDYSGDLIPDAVAAECLASAQALQGHVLAWLKEHRPELLSG